MGKVEEKQKIRKREIKNSLYKLLSEKGIEHVSTSEILSTSGVGNSTFFRLFESKDALLSEMFNDVLQLTFESMEDGAATDLKDYLSQSWDSYVRFVFSYPEKYKFYNQYRNYPSVNALELPLVREALRKWKLHYSIAVREGIVSSIDFDFHANTYSGFLDFTCRYLLAKHNSYDKDLSLRAFEIFWKTLKCEKN